MPTSTGKLGSDNGQGIVYFDGLILDGWMV
jgi:hypothetical protein